MAIKSGKVTIPSSLGGAFASLTITDADVTTSAKIVVSLAELDNLGDKRGQPQFYAVPASGSFQIRSARTELQADTDVYYFVDTDGTGSSVLNLLDFKGNLDASSNPNYPAADVGDAYVVSVAGKVGGGSGKDVQSGDFVVCKTAGASGNEAAVGANWFVLEANNQPASETESGNVELATQAETNAGTDDTRAVTPLKMATYVAAYAPSPGAASESAAGVVELATQAEADAGSDDARAITPLKMATYVAAYAPTPGAASESAAGILELATQAETDGGADDLRAITPMKLENSAFRTAFDNHAADTTNPHSVSKTQVLFGNPIVDVDVSLSAAIAESKLSLDFGTSYLNSTMSGHMSSSGSSHSDVVANTAHRNDVGTNPHQTALSEILIQGNNVGKAGTITGLNDPSNTDEAANKNYVDNGLALKANITVSASAPSAGQGDFWYDTSGTPTLKIYNGATWDVV